MAQANSINASTAGILGNTGTAFTGSSATAHNLIVGGATSSTLVSVAPSSTSGVPVISQGASSDPTFSTMVVAGGGFGVTSNTAYAVLAGGTTSTNPVQSIASVGNVAQVLTSNGAGALPTIQNAPSTNPPKTNVIDYDDFVSFNIFATAIAGTGTPVITSNGTWKCTQTSTVTGSPTTGNPGIVSNIALSVGTFTLNKSGNSKLTPWLAVSGGSISINWVFKLGALSVANPRYTLQFGLASTNGGLITSGSGIYFTYTDNVNTGQYVLNCNTAGTLTSVNTTTAATTTGYHNFGITINSAGTSVSFTIDGSSVGSAITTNIPTVALSPYFTISRSTGTLAASTVNIDLYYLTETLTSSR